MKCLVHVLHEKLHSPPAAARERCVTCVTSRVYLSFGEAKGEGPNRVKNISSSEFSEIISPFVVIINQLRGSECRWTYFRGNLQIFWGDLHRKHFFFFFFLNSQLLVSRPTRNNLSDFLLRQVCVSFFSIVFGCFVYLSFGLIQTVILTFKNIFSTT